MDLISKQTRTAFREHFVGFATLRTIRDAFDAADVPRRDLPPTVAVSGERRTLVEEYYAGVDWRAAGDTRKVPRAYEGALRDLERRQASGDTGCGR